MLCYISIMKQTIQYSQLYKDISVWDFSREALILDETKEGIKEMEAGKKSRRERFEFYREKRLGTIISREAEIVK